MQSLTALRRSGAFSVLESHWHWWIAELRAMVPARLAQRRGRIEHAAIHMFPDRTEIEHIAHETGRTLVDDRPLAQLDRAAWQELAELIGNARARIVLDPSDYYVTDITLPKAARKRLNTAVALRLSQISPVMPELLCWTSTPVEIDEKAVTVRVAMARSARIEEIQSLFEANGIEPPPIVIEGAAGSFELARGHDASRKALPQVERRAWLFAGLLVATIPVSTLAGGTLLRTINDDRAQMLQRDVAPKLAAERRARHAEDLRSALRPLVARPSVSETLDALAERLPPSVYVRSAGQGPDRTLSITIDTADLADVESSLAESPLFPGIALIDQTAGEDGRVLATYRTGRR